MPKDFTSALAPHRAEVERLLRADTQVLGQVWAARLRGETPKSTQQRLNINAGQYGHAVMQSEVLLEGRLPTHVSTAEKAGHKVRGWIRDKDLSPGLMAVLQDVDAQLKRVQRGIGVTFDHPTVEWVKRPVSLQDGKPTGEPIRRRHLDEGCSHFFRDPKDPSKLLGGPPRLASPAEMELDPCHDCVRTAQKLGHPARGEREEVPDQGVDPQGNATAPILAVTDGRSSVVVRREQAHLRRHLLGSRDPAPCGLCGRSLPPSLLVAAHIVPRHALNHSERLDFASAAFLACRLGCDALFEDGYVVVDPSGVVAAGRSASGDVATAVARLVGHTVDGFTAARAQKFARHAQLHA